MATKIIKMVFQFRRATAAEWEANKPVVPAAGEPCFVLDQNILKIGDGETEFHELEPINGVKVEIAADEKSIVMEDSVFKLAGFDAAAIGAQPMKTADGIEWVIPADVTGIEELKKDVAQLKVDSAELKSGVKTLQDTVNTIEGKVDPLTTKVDVLSETVGILNADATVEGSIRKIVNDEIDEFATRIIEDDKINTIAELFEYVAKHGGEVTGMLTDISDLQSKVGNKPVKEQIETAVAGKVDKVEGKDLSSNDFTDSLLSKLEAIEENAQANVIEKIIVGGSILDVVDKVVSIPVAGLDVAGVVKSSTGANKVNISNSGEMSVNKVSVSSLFVPIGDELVLDGGSAYKGAPVYPTRVGNIGYEKIADAVNDAGNGDVITLQEDVNMGSGDSDNLVINAENVTIDLGGKTITANGSSGAIKVESGVTTLDGAGTVSGTLGSDKYSMAVWAQDGTVVINDGIYKNETDGSSRGTDLIYASGNGCIEINGGTFEAAKPEWTLNVKDADYKAGTAKIIVRGGSFKNFDPANNSAEGPGTNFVAEGYKSVKEGNYYVVKPV